MVGEYVINDKLKIEAAYKSVETIKEYPLVQFANAVPVMEEYRSLSICKVRLWHRRNRCLWSALSTFLSTWVDLAVTQ